MIYNKNGIYIYRESKIDKLINILKKFFIKILGGKKNE